MERWIEFQDDGEAVEVFGIHDRNIKLLREHLGVRVTARGHTLHLQGGDEKVSRAAQLLERMAEAVRDGGPSPDRLIDAAVEGLEPEEHPEDADGWDPLSAIARSPGQLAYLQAIASSPVVLAVGPAGTGKTFLAVKMAVDALKKGTVHKMVLGCGVSSVAQGPWRTTCPQDAS